MHQRRITIWTRIPSVTRLLETPIRHLRLYPPGVCEKLKAKLDEREGKRWNIFVKEEWKAARTRHALIVPVNRAFVTGPIQSEILYRVSGFHLASTSPFSSFCVYCPPFKVRISDFLEIFPRKWKVHFGIYFNAPPSSSLSTETVRSPPIFGNFGLVFFSFFFFFEHVLSTFGTVRKNRAGISKSLRLRCRDFNF